jgi:hypothetical protein
MNEETPTMPITHAPIPAYGHSERIDLPTKETKFFTACTCGKRWEGKNPHWAVFMRDEHMAPYIKEQRDTDIRESHAKLARANESLFGTAPDEVYAWMDANRQKKIRKDLTAQLERARRKGSAKTLVPLDTLEQLLGLAA